MPLPPDRWGGVATADEARAKFEAEPPVRVLFESGAGAAPGLPGRRPSSARRRSGPTPPCRRAAGSSTPDRCAGGDRAGGDPAAVAIAPDPAVGQRTFWNGSSSAIWKAVPAFDWDPAAPGTEAAFETAPLTESMTMLGTGSVDLWVRSTATDADLEVVLSEVRPDGQEVLVQTGRLRASYRALERSSTELHPIQLGRERGIAPLPAGQWTKARVLIPAFGHVFRPGSRVRLAINTPGGDQATWSYELLDLPAGTEHLLGTGGAAASSVALPLVPGQVGPGAAPTVPVAARPAVPPAPAIANVVVPAS